jgi:hypothetical protein
MTVPQIKRATSAYRVRRLLTTLAPEQLRELISVERQDGRAFGNLAELCREELARRCEQP